VSGWIQKKKISVFILAKFDSHIYNLWCARTEALNSTYLHLIVVVRMQLQASIFLRLWPSSTVLVEAWPFMCGWLERWIYERVKWMHPYECVFNKPERRIKKDHKIKTGIESVLLITGRLLYLKTIWLSLQSKDKWLHIRTFI
jgi:hypothetical protein